MIEKLWPSGPFFRYDADVLSPGIDSILLAYFAGCAQIKKKNYAIDLGCGSGIISVLLAWDNPGMKVDCVEIQPHAAQLATCNATLSGMADRINVIEGDMRDYATLFRKGFYDVAISNPPYHRLGSGKSASREKIAAARFEETCSIFDVCRAAGYLTGNGGSFFLVHLPSRLAEVFRALDNSGFEPKRLRFVQHSHLTPPTLVLIESRRGGKPTIKVEAPIILVNNDGSDTDEMNVVYRR